MKNSSADGNGYEYMISEGLRNMDSLNRKLSFGKGSFDENIRGLRDAIDSADSIIIGAGAGLSTSAGLTYSGERFRKYFSDFVSAYGISDMYSGGFYPFPEPEIKWAWWSRHIYYNRYIEPPRPVYRQLLSLVKDKDYFVITTNVDHQFQRAGFDKDRLFCTQGDYGLFQNIDGSVNKTYDNEDTVMKMMKSQGFIKVEGVYQIPESGVSMRIPSELVPICPDDGRPMVMNLRSDDTFVEDDGWRRASARYCDYLKQHEHSKVLYLEAGVGYNTPIIIKYPFWSRVLENQNATYACLNYGEAYCPKEILNRSICIDGDIGDVLSEL